MAKMSCSRARRDKAARIARSAHRHVQRNECVKAWADLEDLQIYDDHLCLSPASRVRLASQVKGCFHRKLQARAGWRHRRYGR